ncbi:hypothetical protein ACFL0K_00250 [Patescibacteria group bacterium]
MKKTDLEKLRSGPSSRVRESAGTNAFVVTEKLGLHEATVQRTLRIMNPLEWLANGKPFDKIGDLRSGDTLKHVTFGSTFVVEEVGEISAFSVETKTINLNNFDQWDIIS